MCAKKVLFIYSSMISIVLLGLVLTVLYKNLIFKDYKDYSSSELLSLNSTEILLSGDGPLDISSSDKFPELKSASFSKFSSLHKSSSYSSSRPLEPSKQVKQTKKLRSGIDYNILGIHIKEPDILGFYIKSLHSLNVVIKIKITYDNGLSRSISLLLNTTNSDSIPIWVNGIDTLNIDFVEIDLFER